MITRIFLAALAISCPSKLIANDYVLGQSSWELERLSDQLVLLRSEIIIVGRNATPKRQGLMIATCDREIRRIRFQLGQTPLSPSINPAANGRAIIRGTWNGPRPHRLSSYCRAEEEEGSDHSNERVAKGDDRVGGHMADRRQEALEQ
jgi:hypothetical protein